MKPHSFKYRFEFLASALLVASPSSVGASEPATVAGLAPWQRPAQAPRITTVAQPDRKLALHGIGEPLPPNLKFLDDQGGWYTPFTRPGMPAPYDLRGWHSPHPTSRQDKK